MKRKTEEVLCKKRLSRGPGDKKDGEGVEADRLACEKFGGRTPSGGRTGKICHFLKKGDQFAQG